MLAHKAKIYHDCPARANNGFTPEELEECIQAAIEAYHNKEASNLLAAAYQQGIEKKYSTDSVLIEWIQFLGATGQPISKYTIHPYVYDLGGRFRSQQYQIKGGSLELVTIIECVCADGTSLLPGFIFSGGTVDKWWTKIDPQIIVTTSENGWTSKPLLLVCDGHGSHALDIGVFEPMQKAWLKCCKQYCTATDYGMQWQHVVKEYMAACANAFTKNTILQAW
ncbi:hypothetical protein J3A83DRAFT_4190036 [Scleroderma citrinum]